MRPVTELICKNSSLSEVVFGIRSDRNKRCGSIGEKSNPPDLGIISWTVFGNVNLLKANHVATLILNHAIQA